ncbi:EcsC family protein [Clostridium botulinum]|nr:EcsC family protein [Clostridium botulinum]
MLYIFQLAFSEGYERRKTYNKIINWSSYSENYRIILMILIGESFSKNIEIT